jgi:hypothetical protein
MKSAREINECVFVPGRVCPVELEEIPLEVCRLCMEAWRLSGGNMSVKPHVSSSRLQGGGEPSGRLEVSGAVEAKPSFGSGSFTSARSQLSLSELDRLFWEGRIEVDEYVRRRREIVNSMKRGESSFASFERAIENLDLIMLGKSFILLVEDGKVKVRHPEGEAMPEGFEVSGDVLKAVQELFTALSRRRMDAQIEVGLKRIMCLGCRGRRIILLIVDSRVSLEKLEGGLMEARRMLGESESWEKILPLIHNVILGGARSAVEEG